MENQFTHRNTVSNPVAMIVEDDNINARLCQEFISRWWPGIEVDREVTEDMAYEQIVAQNDSIVIICLDNQLIKGTGGILLARLWRLKANHNFNLLPNCEKLVLMSAQGADVLFDQAMQLGLPHTTIFPLGKGNITRDLQKIFSHQQTGFTSSVKS